VSGNTKRNYRKEYDNYQGKPEQKKRRAKKAGKVRKGDGKDVDHSNGNPNDNNRSNLKVKSKSSNRSYARTKRAGKKSKSS